jgi:ubiquitin C-terminal hydrolase
LFDESYYKYRLVGVLVHSGTAESGHYYSYIRDGEKWYEFNDSMVSEFNIANLKSETFGGDDSPVRGVNDWDATSNKSRNAYLLFYERIQPI